MSRLSVELLREELERRSLETTGTKDELVQRLHKDIQESRDSTPTPAQTPPAANFSLDAATIQALAALMQQLPRPSTVVTTLPDLSASIPSFDESPRQSVNAWLDEVRRVQQLASWDDATTRLIAASKLKGTARNWHLTFGHQYVTWQEWRNALKNTF